MKARKILHLIESLGHGGAEHQLALTVGSLDPSRFESVVCHLQPPDFLAARIRARGIEVESLSLPDSRLAWPAALAQVIGVARRHGVDLIHTSLYEADVIGGTAASILGKPAISTLCNIGGDEIRLADNPRNSRLKLKLSTTLWGFALRRLHRKVVAISEAVKESAVRTYGLSADRITVIYRALPTDEPPSVDEIGSVRTELELEGRFPVLLNVGRLAPQKGQIYLVEALPAIARRFPGAMALIVGEGWLREPLLKRAEELGVTKHLRLLGKREDVPALMAAADLFVFPSLFEGLGVSALQAAAAGMPSILSNTGPLPEILEHEQTGILVPPRDARALSSAVLRLAEAPADAKAMALRGQQSVRARFTTERMMRGIEAVYDSILTPPESTP